MKLEPLNIYFGYPGSKILPVDPVIRRQPYLLLNYRKLTKV